MEFVPHEFVNFSKTLVAKIENMRNVQLVVTYTPVLENVENLIKKSLHRLYMNKKVNKNINTIV